MKIKWVKFSSEISFENLKWLKQMKLAGYQIKNIIDAAITAHRKNIDKQGKK